MNGKIMKSLALIMFVALVPLSGYAQYKVYEWESFESGRLREIMPIIGKPDKISIVKWDTVAGMPPEFRNPEIAQYGLSIRAEKVPAEILNKGIDEHLSGMCFPIVLDRKLLGDAGRALFQADFYIPPKDMRQPNVAVLAVAPLLPNDTIPRSMYRFGMGGGKGVYFSHVLKDSEQPNIKVDDLEIMDKVPRPGWHRFAIVFEGQETIRFYIDGHQPKFSPVKDASMQQLQLGILLADFYYDYLCYMDNPSIQYTMEDAPLPDSPYAASWGDGGGGGAAGTGAQAVLPGAQAINWLSAEEGWQQAMQTQKQMFVYFQSPRALPTKEFNAILDTDAAAKSFVQNYIPINIDINQLQGGKHAEKFQIWKVPAVLILAPDGKELHRAIFSRKDTWETFAGKLK